MASTSRKAGLGRGLGALLGDPIEAVRSATAPPQELPIGQVEPNPDQPRKVFDEADMEALTDSVQKNGILQPIVVREKEGTYQIVAGERRYQAARRAGLTTVPVYVRNVADEEILQLALIENLQRSDLNPMEAAQGYRSLIEQNGITQEELGNILSKSRPSIANALRLLDLPQEVQDMVRDGKLTAGHARAILAVEGDAGRLALAKKVIEDGLSVRQTETLGPLFSDKESRQRPKRVPAPEEFKRAARKLRRGLDTKVSIKTVRGKSKIEIEFDGEEQLKTLVERLLETKEA